MSKTFKVIIKCSDIDTALYYAHMAINDGSANEEGKQDVLSVKIIKQVSMLFTNCIFRNGYLESRR